MNRPTKNLEALFDAALALEPGAPRRDYLARACPSPELRREIEALLEAHQDADTLLAGDPAQTETRPGIELVCERPGDHIGRYRLLEKLGEGGFGIVYMAEQREPVKRKVALKIIKVGMDTREVVARFEAERQALALMDHPHIAKVLDGGATDTGRPYFVMELVRGIKLTAYCDQHQLGLEERLKLFMAVCHAVQHAHQKGIIHRDLKPSNILVTLHDGVPVPKVIDFGIAKAMQQELTEKTLFTQFHQFLGTPSYMSPEQAELSGLDIDTRSDIYSLGVLLYELLVGQPPFDGQALLRAGLDEMRRTLREVEPPRPSTRLTRVVAGVPPAVEGGILPPGLDRESSRALEPATPVPRGETPGSTAGGTPAATTVAPRHRIPQKDLIHQLRGDLDWIVMKCLEKDRARRYETANGLAADLQRHLSNEPVTARPPSAAYRFSKMVRRNKGVFAFATAVLVMLVVGIMVTTWQAIRATNAELEQARLRHEADLARQREVKLRQEAETRENITKAGFLYEEGRIEEADVLMSQASIGQLEANVRNSEAFRFLGNWHVHHGRWSDATNAFQTFLSLMPEGDTAEDRYSKDILQLGCLLIHTGDRAAYANLRHGVLARFSDTPNSRNLYRSIQLALLLPTADAEESKRIGQMAKRLQEMTTEWEADSWHKFLLAWLEYRQGNFVMARQSCHEAMSSSPMAPEPLAGCALALLAAAHQRLNQTAEARARLAQSKALVASRKERRTDAFWHDWMIAGFLIQEASALMELDVDPASK